MRVALSFTGGKDSVLAAHIVLNDRLRAIAGWTGERDILQHVGEAEEGASTTNAPAPTPLDLRGVDVRVAALVTFAPPASAANPSDEDDDDERGFKAHPLRLVRAQAAALGAGIARSAGTTPPPPPPPFLVLDIVPPHADSYATQLAYLKTNYGIDALVTGDVLDVCNGFMAKACARAGVRLVTPLWQQPRERILAALGALQIRALLTCVDVGKFLLPGGTTTVDPVKDLLGRELTREMWQDEDGALHTAHKESGVDLCGEGGEYHSAAFEAPHLFAAPLRMEVKGHAFKGERHAHVLLGRVEADDDAIRIEKEVK